MKVVVINGKPRAGKDTFVELCQKHILWCGNISTVGFVKEVAKFCGWNGEKTPENRAFLSNLKDLLTQWADVPYRQVQREIALKVAECDCQDFSTEDLVIFVHCREPEEIARFVADYNAITLFISRPDVEGASASNHADAEVANFEYDYTIVNDGTIRQLEYKALDFIHSIMH